MNVYPHEIKAVIFDNDGTIVDTIELYFSIMEEMVNDNYINLKNQSVYYNYLVME